MKKKIILLLALLMALTLVFVACKDDPKPPVDGTTVADPNATEEPTQGEDPTEAPTDPETPTEAPSDEVTEEPTAEPTDEPTEKPTEKPEDPTEPPTEPETEDPMEPVNVFQAADISTITGGDPNNLTQDCVTLEDGYLHVVPIGPDPYWYPFAGVDGARYVAIRYRTDATGADIQFYIGSAGGGPQDDSSMLRQPVIADSEWHVAIIDTQSLIDAGIYDGKYVSYFRLDALEAGYILNDAGEPWKDESGQWVRYSLPEGCSIDVAYVGFFHSEEAVAQYDFEQYPPYVEPSAAGVVANSFDTFYVNGKMYFETDGGAGDKLTAINNTLTFASASELQSIMLRGWIGFSQPIVSFGYYVDNYEYVYGEFKAATEDGVKGAGGEHATRFEILVPLDYLEGDDHMVGFVALLEDGTVVRLREEIIIDLPELPEDITDTFVADVNSNEIGTAYDASDLANFFVIELPLGSEGVIANGEGKAYNMTGISDMYADVNGRYYIRANQLGGNGYVFVRGYKVVNSDAVIENFDPNAGIYKINNYYEVDSAGSYAGAGIFAHIDGSNLVLMVKYYNPETVTRVGNKYYTVPVEGTEITMADNGSVVAIMVDGKTYATIALSGSVVYGDINEVMPKNGFAEKAVVTLADGTTDTIENTLIADTCECQVGLVVRGGSFKFDTYEVGAYSAIEIPDMENVTPEVPEEPKFNKYEGTYHSNVDHVNAKGPNGEPNYSGLSSSKLNGNNGEPPVREAAADGIVLGDDCLISIGGWMAVQGGINHYAYTVNDSDLIAAVGGKDGMPLENYYDNLGITEASKNGMFNGDSKVIADLSAYAGQTVTVTFYAIPEVAQDTVAPIVVITGVVVPGTAPEEPAYEHDYVADGLVALYNPDGQDASNSVWKDLVGKNHVNVTLNEKNYFTEEGLVLSGAVKNHFPTGIVNTINGNAYTVEISLANLEVIGRDFATIMNATNDRFALFYRTSNGVLEFKFAGCPGTQRNIIQNGLSILQDAVITITYEVGGNSIIYINGELASTMPAQGAMEAPDLFFGHEEELKQFNALFRSIRFYDRALTAEEVAANYAVDKAPVEPDEPDVPGAYDPDATYQNIDVNLGLGGKGAPFSSAKNFGQRYNIGDNLLKKIFVLDMATYEDGNVNTFTVKVWQWNADYATTVAAEPLFVFNGENHVNCTSLSVDVPVELGIHGDIYYEIEYLTGAAQFTGWVAGNGPAEGVETYVGGNLADGTYVSYITVAQKVEGELMDTHNFQSNASAIDTSNGNVSFPATDLPSAFVVALGQGDIGNAYLGTDGLYTMSGFNALFTTPNGAYAYSFKNLQTVGHPGFTGIFFRGIMAGGENTYYGSDGNDPSANSFGCGGIYICPTGGKLRINVKTIVDGKIVPAIYETPIDSSDITVVDKGSVISIIAGDKLVATIVLNGTADYGIANVAANASAASATLTFADGTVNEIANVYAAANMIEGNIGFGTRGSGSLTFEAVSIMPANTVTVPEFPHIHSYETVVTDPTCTEDGYTTYTCACGDTYTADVVTAPGHNYVDGTCGICGAADPDYVAPVPTTPEEIVNAAYELAEGADLEGTYTLTGVITSIDSAWSDKYGNISVWMQIGDMSDKQILAFRLAGEGASTLKIGDTITVTGTLTNYYGKIEFKQGCTLDAVVPGEEPEPEDPSIPGMTDATIDFADHTYRTEVGDGYQIFSNDGFIFTQNQGESTSWNSDYIGPIRLYKSHVVTFEYAGMTKIVIDGNPGKPVSAWADTVTDANATVTIDGNTITIEFATPVDVFSVVMSAQVRVNAITVYAPEATDEPEEPAANEIKVTTTDTYGWFDEYTFTAGAAGTYTFTVPAGLGFYSLASANAWGDAEIDYVLQPDGGDVVVYLAEGEAYTFMVGAETKADWVITWSYAEGEPEPEEPVLPSEPVELVVGENTLTVNDADMTEGALYGSFTVTEAGTYEFVSSDLMAIIYFADGSQQRGMAYLEPGVYEIVVAIYAWAPGTYTMTVNYTAPVVEDVVAEGSINVTTTDTYGWFDEYTFTAEVAGVYTFNLPAGLGLWSVASNAPELDYQMEQNGGTVTVTLAAGEAYTFIVGAFTKADWVIDYSATAVEGGDVVDPEPEPDPEPAGDISGTYSTGGDDTLVIDMTAGTMVYTFAGRGGAMNVAEYGISIADGVVTLSNANGPIGDAMAIYVGKLELDGNGAPAKFYYNGYTYDVIPAGEVVEPEPEEPVGDLVLVIGDNYVTITDDIIAAGGIEYQLVVTDEGTYTVQGDFFVQMFDANGMSYSNGSYLTAGTYTVKLGTMLISFAGDYNAKVVYTAPEGGDEGGDQATTTELPANVDVEGEHDLYYDFYAAEDLTLVITYSEGCYVSGLPGSYDKDEENMTYTVNVSAGESFTINPWSMGADGHYTFTVTPA